MKNKKYKIKYQNIYFLIGIICMLCTFFMLNSFNKKAMPKIILMSKTIVDKMNNIIISNCVAKDYFNNDTLSSLIKIQKNSNDEIINVDFDMTKLYEITNHISNNIVNEITDIDLSHIDFVQSSDSKNKMVILAIPSGVASDNVLFYNLGPKIPLKVAYVGNLFTNIKTTIKDYGINNALIEVYICIDIHTQIVAPFIKEDNKSSYNLLVASSVIQGSIPDYYNGLLEYNSDVNKTSIN